MKAFDLAVGMGAALAASACYEVSYALQALESRGVHPEHALRASLLGRLVRRPRWLVAIAIAIAGWVFQIVALGFAPLSIVQAVLALGLVLLLYLGVRVLGEAVGTREIAAVAIVIAGVCAIGLAAPDRVENATGIGHVLVAAVVLGVAVLAPYAFRESLGRHAITLAVSAGAADALAAIAAKVVSDQAAAGSPGVAAIWAAGAGGAVLLGLTSELTALQRLPATRVAPVVLVMQTTIPVVLAPVLFGESWKGTPLGGGVIAAGLALVAIGTALVSSSRAVAAFADAGSAGELEHDRGRGWQVSE